MKYSQQELNLFGITLGIKGVMNLPTDAESKRRIGWGGTQVSWYKHSKYSMASASVMQLVDVQASAWEQHLWTIFLLYYFSPNQAANGPQQIKKLFLWNLKPCCKYKFVCCSEVKVSTNLGIAGTLEGLFWQGSP